MSWAPLIFDSSRRPEAALRQVVVFAITNTSTLNLLHMHEAIEIGSA